MNLENLLLKNSSIFFMCNVVCGLLASLLRLPSIIGYMVSGLLLGPFAIKYVVNKETLDLVHQVGDFGLIIFMCLIGLELDIGKFLKSGVFKHVSFAFLQFVYSSAFVFTLLLAPKSVIYWICGHPIIVSVAVGLFGIIYSIYNKHIDAIINRYSAKLKFVYSFIILTIFSFISYIRIENVQISSISFFNNIHPLFFPIIGALGIMLILYRILKAFFRNSINQSVAKYVVITLVCISLGLLFYLEMSYLMQHNFEILYIIKNYVVPYIVFVSLLIIVYGQYNKEIESFKMNPVLLIFIALILIFIGNIRESFLWSLTLMDSQIIVLLVALLALNSTAVALKLLENRDQKENHLGTNLIGVLISQDLMFMAVIIFLKGFRSGISVWNLSYKLALAALILYAVNAVCRSKPSFISNALDYIRKAGSDLMILFVIGFCCIAAFIFDAIGVSDVYGAFVFGLLIGNVYKHRHSMLSLCDPISAVLMSVFFVYIGLLINLDNIQKHLGIIILINTVVMVFKYLSNYSINSIIHRDNPEFTTLCIIISSLLLTQMSEFSLLIIEMVMYNVDATTQSVIFGMNRSDFYSFLEFLKSSSIVSLTFGCLVTVLLKRIVYRRHSSKIDELDGYKMSKNDEKPENNINIQSVPAQYTKD